jgi:hypothetical protein
MAPQTTTVVAKAVAPSTPSARAATYTGKRVVRLRPRDVDRKGRPGAGVKTTKYRVNSGAWRIGTGVTLKPPTRGKVKKYVVRYYSVDKLGHQETTHSRTLYIRG